MSEFNRVQTLIRYHMSLNAPHDFNCKIEELPVICSLANVSLKRDQADFLGYSPKFNQEYVDSFETKIVTCEELVSPKSETAQMKIITERISKTTANLVDPNNRLEGYVNLAFGTIKLSPADFGISDLRKGIFSGDVEKVLKSLSQVSTNITTYKEALEQQGLTDVLAAKFSDSYVTLKADKLKQYEILTNRKAIVQNNMATLNGLYANLNEILKIGKILYKQTDQVKLKEYTFTELKKQVHRIKGTNNGPDKDNPDNNDSTSN